MSPYCQTYNSENMTTINLNDTLPLTAENSNEKVIELSDDEKLIMDLTFHLVRIQKVAQSSFYVR